MNKTQAGIGYTRIIRFTSLIGLTAAIVCSMPIVAPAFAQPVDPAPTPALEFKTFLPALSGGPGSTTPTPPPTPLPTTQPGPTATPSVTPSATPSSQPTPTATATQPPPQGDPLPSQMVGLWWTGKLLPRELYDPTTGAWGSTNGLGQMYEFGPSGTYTYTAKLIIESPSCASSVTVFKRGIVKLAGNTLTTTPTFGRTRTQIACGSQEVTIDESPGKPETLPYEVGYDPKGVIQFLLGSTNPASEPTRYYKDGLAPELIATWRNGGTVIANFYNPATQQFVAQPGEGDWIRISPDGKFQTGQFSRVTNDQGCQLSGWGYQEGSVTVSGNHITFTPNTGVRRIENACDPGNPQQGAWTSATAGFSFEFLDRETMPKLALWPDAQFRQYVYEKVS